ncbi:MAG: phosphoadenosine phosphosulfate reductase [Pelagimonas sp.]|nr:phosphoadenosine phosphosulfate reductase [Pelagimonas sp.]
MAQFAPDLSKCSAGEWLSDLRDIGQEHGFSVSLGRKHAGIFIDGNDTLLVSFETIGGIKALSETHTPFGFDLVRSNGWSSLSLISSGDTWFRDPMVYGFFDQLMDDGFFDEFENVIFFGAGPAGYAAAAYSVAAPGARVLTLQPQATLDPRVTEWDDRFPEQRRMDFTSRYGYAPDMIDAASAAYVIYDPHQMQDAMHSALFERRNVTRFRVPFMGGALLNDFRTMDLLPSLLTAVAEDRLTTQTFARLMRARRQHMPYLRKLLAHTDREQRLTLSRWICANVGPRMSAPRFRRRLEQIEAMDAANAEV